MTPSWLFVGPLSHLAPLPNANSRRIYLFSAYHEMVVRIFVLDMFFLQKRGRPSNTLKQTQDSCKPKKTLLQAVHAPGSKHLLKGTSRRTKPQSPHHARFSSCALCMGAENCFTNSYNLLNNSVTHWKKNPDGHWH